MFLGACRFLFNIEKKFNQPMSCKELLCNFYLFVQQIKTLFVPFFFRLFLKTKNLEFKEIVIDSFVLEDHFFGTLPKVDIFKPSQNQPNTAKNKKHHYVKCSQI